MESQTYAESMMAVGRESCPVTFNLFSYTNASFQGVGSTGERIGRTYKEG